MTSMQNSSSSSSSGATSFKRCATVSVLVGVYLMVASHSVVTLWGNLSVYVISFLHFRVGQDKEDSATWLIALNFLGYNVGYLLCERVTKSLGPRLAVAANGLLVAASLSLSFLSIQHSFGALLVTYSLPMGLSLGLGHGMQMTLVPVWVAPKHQGIACCSILAILQIGSLLMIVVVTWFINPNNYAPDAIVQEEKLFSQPDLLDRVPYVFLLHGAIAFTLLAISCALIREKPEDVYIEPGENDENKVENSGNSLEYVEIDGSLSRDVKPGEGLTQEEEISKSNSENYSEKRCYDTYNLPKEDIAAHPAKDSICGIQNLIASCLVFEPVREECEETHLTDNIIIMKHTYYLGEPDRNQREPTAQINKTLDVADTDTDQSQRQYVTQCVDPSKDDKTQEMDSKILSYKVQSNSPDLTPRQALKTREFYVLLFMTLCADGTFVTFGTYYKIFGMLLYPDDHFFANVSVAITVGVFLVAMVTGFACDTFGLKNTLIASSALMAIVVAFFYSSLFVSPWLYSALVVTLIGLNYVQYNMSAICCVYYFGKSHSTTISGIALSAICVSNIIMPIVVQFILSSYSWQVLFASMNVFTVLYILSVMLGLPVASLSL